MATKRKSDLVEEEVLKTEMAEMAAEAAEEAQDPRDAEIAKLKEELSLMKGGGMKDADRVEALARETAEKGLNPWDVKVSVRVPRRPVGEDSSYWVNVNDRSAQIPANDQIQEMKLPFAEVLMNHLKAENAARDFADNIQVYDPVSNPHPVN